MSVCTCALAACRAFFLVHISYRTYIPILRCHVYRQSKLEFCRVSVEIQEIYSELWDREFVRGASYRASLQGSNSSVDGRNFSSAVAVQWRRGKTNGASEKRTLKRGKQMKYHMLHFIGIYITTFHLNQALTIEEAQEKNRVLLNRHNGEGKRKHIIAFKRERKKQIINHY